MAVMIAHASSDERGKLSGGKAGDQTGREVCVRTWYNRPWSHVIRFKEAGMAEKFAWAMERAADNPHIGYDQNQRNTLLAQARKCGYDPGAVTVDCETDCSALVSVCCVYAGIPEGVLFKGGNLSMTSNLRARLVSTGMVEVLTGKKYTAAGDLLLRGDILLYEKHHVAGVVRGAEAANQAPTKPEPSPNQTPTKSVVKIAKEVIAGKWGSGNDRRQRLAAAGYDYAAVQAEVNRLLKSR